MPQLSAEQYERLFSKTFAVIPDEDPTKELWRIMISATLLAVRRTENVEKAVKDVLAPAVNSLLNPEEPPHQGKTVKKATPKEVEEYDVTEPPLAQSQVAGAQQATRTGGGGVVSTSEPQPIVKTNGGVVTTSAPVEKGA